MLNKIKEQILHILRKLCGYYKLECENATLYSEQNFYRNKIMPKLESKLESKNLEYDILSAQHEAKILEYDILDNKYNEGARAFQDLENDYKNMLVGLTNGQMEYFEDTSDYVQTFQKVENIINNNYKKYLVAELEEILNIMKQKGIHPQDLIKRIINKANRDIKE